MSKDPALSCHPWRASTGSPSSGPQSLATFKRDTGVFYWQMCFAEMNCIPDMWPHGTGIWISSLNCSLFMHKNAKSFSRKEKQKLRDKEGRFHAIRKPTELFDSLSVVFGVHSFCLGRWCGQRPTGHYQRFFYYLNGFTYNVAVTAAVSHNYYTTTRHTNTWNYSNFTKFIRRTNTFLKKKTWPLR